MLFIGIDIGTSSVKIIAVNEEGTILNSVSREYPISFPKPLWAEQDPNDWWEHTLDGLKELLKELDKTQVKGISLSGQMHGLVTLDKHDHIIRPAILWNDQRAHVECDYLNHTIGQKNISNWTGNRGIIGFTAPKLLWMRKNEPENFTFINKIMLPKDYIIYKLSGIFATDMSDASGTLYLDVKNRRWSAEMLELLGVSIDQVPELYESYEVIGNIKGELAEDLEIGMDTKIIIGAGDQAAAAVGGGVVGPSSCSLSLGTSGVVFTSNDRFFVDENNSLHSFCHANGKYHLMGVTLAAAASLKWWIEKITKTENYDRLLSEAEATKIDDTLFYLPYLSGERTPHFDPNCRGVFIGMDITHERKHMTRSVLEGVAFSLRDTFEIMKSMGISINKVIINGGGAKSNFWCQIIADVLNVEVNKLNTNEGPAYGAAILAAVGCGLFDSVEEACHNFLKVTESIIPNKENTLLYDRKYKKFTSIYPTTKQLFKELI